MRNYQISHLNSLASQVGNAKRNLSYRQIEAAQRRYKAFRALYRLDSWVRQPRNSVLAAVALTLAICAPIVGAAVLSLP